MCLALYASADFELLLVANEESTPFFSVADIRGARLQEVGRWLPGSSMRFLIADGCACGFIDYQWDGEAHDEALLHRTALGNYLKEAVSQGDVTLLAMWFGDEDKEPRQVASEIGSLDSYTFSATADHPLLIRLTRSTP